LVKNSSLMRLESVIAGYGARQVLDGISLCAAAGEIVALVGHNGVSKSTLFKTIFGLVPMQSGNLYLDGERIQTPSPRGLLSSGLALCVGLSHKLQCDLKTRSAIALGENCFPFVFVLSALVGVGCSREELRYWIQ
jgi:branched-chain amino acid transport system ATP-binding protein